MSRKTNLEEVSFSSRVLHGRNPGLKGGVPAFAPIPSGRVANRNPFCDEWEEPAKHGTDFPSVFCALQKSYNALLTISQQFN
ncbi:MAG: hypothetical protein LBO79_08390 [Zoogloeaceae bacterium]|nr:hypothetical protein [Zoogloeaceae bacterium]